MVISGCRVAFLLIPEDVAFLSQEAVQVYAVALYVEAEQAGAELQRLRAEGFFNKGYSDDRVMEALVQGR